MNGLLDLLELVIVDHQHLVGVVDPAIDPSLLALELFETHGIGVVERSFFRSFISLESRTRCRFTS
jgi:hypothetical protein